MATHSDLRKEGVVGHNAKLKRMTEGYGMADKAMFKVAPVNKYKTEGDEDAVGFGADDAAPNASASRPARKTSAANPLATYRKGGAVKAREQGGGVIARARGGAAKKKGGTHVNVIVAPQQPSGGGGPMAGANPAMAALPPSPPPMPPKPPMGGPAGLGGGPLPGGPMGMSPIQAGAPGGIPPGLIPPRKRGGHVTHSDEAEDKALVRHMVKPTALRAKGGRVHMTAGAESGPGRLEKTAIRARHARSEKPKAV